VLYITDQIAKAKPDLSVLKEYKQREQEFMNRAQDLENITAERDAQKAKYEGLRKQRLDEFLSGFNSISLKLKEMYQVCWSEIAEAQMTDGGRCR
jgi:structural maintenance of chromosome 4